VRTNSALILPNSKERNCPNKRVLLCEPLAIGSGTCDGEVHPVGKPLTCQGLKELKQQNVATELLPLLASESNDGHEMNNFLDEAMGVEFEVHSYTQLLEME